MNRRKQLNPVPLEKLCYVRGELMILIDFYIDGEIYASRTSPCVPQKGDTVVLKDRKKYLVVCVDWVFCAHSTGHEQYVNISLAE